jgi:hypothetical protein
MKNFAGGINPALFDDMLLRRFAQVVKDYMDETQSALANSIGPGNSPTAIGGDLTSHHILSDLTNYDDHPQYLYLSGRAGGQVLTSADSSAGVPALQFNTLTAGSSEIALRVHQPSANPIAWSVSADGSSQQHGSLLVSSPTGLVSTLYSDSTLVHNDNPGPAVYTSSADTFTNIATSFNFKATAGGTTIFQMGLGAGSGTLTGLGADINLNASGGNSPHLKISNVSGSAAAIPVKVIAHATQSGDLQEFLASDGTTKLSYFDSSGAFNGAVVGIFTGNILETQITNGALLARVADNETITGSWTYGTGSDPPVSGTTFWVDNSGSYTAGLGLILATAGESFKTSLQREPGVAVADNVVFFPASADVVLVGSVEVATLSNKTLDNSNIFNSTNATNGAKFQDTTTASKKLRVVLSGSVGNNAFTIANTAARTYTFGNDTGTVDLIVAPTSATTDKTGQTASIGATTAYTTVHAGRYRVSAYAVFTAVTVPGNLTMTALWTDPQQAQTGAINSGIAYTAVGSYETGSIEIYSTSGSTIQFSTTLTGTGTYNIYVRVQSLT